MEQNSRQRIYKTIMLILITVLITVIITASLIYKKVSEEGNTKYVLVSSEQSKIGEDIEHIKKIIDKYYLGEIDEEKLRNGALSGFVDGLEDEYTKYISKEEYDDFSASIMGNYVGIGIYMSVYKDSGEIVIVSTMKESPAEEAGLKSGDIILKVDEVEYKGVDGLEDAANHIKGEEGTTVKLEIKRKEEILNFSITRRKVIINPITADVIEGTNIGYIQITSFDENCSSEFKNKYEELSNRGIQSLIIDVRNNGGGIVQEAIEIANYIVPKGKALMITVNKSNKETIEYSKDDPIINVPVVIIANENSASASEILIGALRDNECAKFVGKKTYGKGVIQEVLKLKDGSALKITTDEYFTPNKTKINKVGIEPDEVVELLLDNLEGFEIAIENDTQINKAIEILK